MSFDITYFEEFPKDKKYRELLRWQEESFQEETDALANISNSLALLFAVFGELNWCGFYYLKEKESAKELDKKLEQELVLGHFQGFPACTRIALGKGVCGTAAQKKETIVVPDVHNFPGHIACDARSQSEIVLPVLQNGKLIGVLDIDSPVKNRFGEKEIELLNKFLAAICKNIDFSKLI